MSREILLTRGKVTIVDDDDFEWLNQWKWCARETSPLCWYVARSAGPRRLRVDIRMHRLILSPAPDQMIDHINHDGLDNRRCNLRLCNHRQNNANSRWTNPTGFRGVQKERNASTWNARITLRPRAIYLGSFHTPEEAARAYDKAAIEAFGEFATLNFSSAALEPQT